MLKFKNKLKRFPVFMAFGLLALAPSDAALAVESCDQATLRSTNEMNVFFERQSAPDRVRQQRFISQFLTGQNLGVFNVQCRASDRWTPITTQSHTPVMDTCGTANVFALDKTEIWTGTPGVREFRAETVRPMRIELFGQALTGQVRTVSHYDITHHRYLEPILELTVFQQHDLPNQTLREALHSVIPQCRTSSDGGGGSGNGGVVENAHVIPAGMNAGPAL